MKVYHVICSFFCKLFITLLRHINSCAIYNVVSSHKAPHCTISSVPFLSAKMFISFSSFECDLVDWDVNSLLMKLEDKHQELGFNGSELRYRSMMEGLSLPVLHILKVIELFFPAKIMSVAHANLFQNSFVSRSWMLCHELIYMAHYLNLLTMREGLPASSSFIINGFDFPSFVGIEIACNELLHFWWAPLSWLC